MERASVAGDGHDEDVEPAVEKKKKKGGERKRVCGMWGVIVVDDEKQAGLCSVSGIVPQLMINQELHTTAIDDASSSFSSSARPSETRPRGWTL